MAAPCDVLREEYTKRPKEKRGKLLSPSKRRVLGLNSESLTSSLGYPRLSQCELVLLLGTLLSKGHPYLSLRPAAAKWLIISQFGT
jgi:hypothetical protein